MPQVSQINVDHTNQVVRITLNDGSDLSFSFDEYEKLQAVNLGDWRNKPKFVPNDMAEHLKRRAFSEGINAAINSNVLTFHEGLVVQDYTNRGFANANVLQDGNPLFLTFPKYWDFLQSYRQTMNDPHLT